jgi:hypothetical protein
MLPKTIAPIRILLIDLSPQNQQLNA